MVKKHMRLQYNYQQQVQTMKIQQQLPNHTFFQEQKQRKEDSKYLSQTENHSTSHYYQYLQNGFRKFSFQSLISQLKQHQIKYHPYESYDHFSLHLIRYSTNLRVITIRVCLGPFSTELIIYNSPEESFTHPLNCINGTCSNVYFLKSSQKNVAIKCIQLQESYAVTALRVIKEYFINRIASALKVGPKLFKISQQFDLIFYSGCIQFSMQKCDFTEQYTFSQQHQNKLKESLLKLHTLNIVHCDIKAANIVYSISYGSLVFIDFGFSKFLPTKQGTKRKMKFVGSLQTCCRQMMQLYVSKKYGYIDLYDNDSFSLRATINGDLTQETGHDLDDIMRQRNVAEPYDLLKTFSQLYTDRNFNATDLFLESQKSDKKTKIMDFISLLPPTESLREFYMRILKNQWQDSIIFSQATNRFCHSYKHSLKLHHKLLEQSVEQGEQSPVRKLDMSKFIQQFFSTQLSLQDLENDQIDEQEETIGLNNFLSTSKNAGQKYYDFFLSRIGIINHITLNNSLKEKNYETICNHFFNNFVSSNPEKNYQIKEKVLMSFQYLKKFSLTHPSSKLKQRIFQKVISELLLIKKVQFDYILHTINQIIQLQICAMQKIDLMLALIKGMIFQIATWGNFSPKDGKDEFQVIQSLQSKFEQLDFRSSSFQKVLKFDLFLLINLIKKERTSDCIQLMRNSIKYLKQGQIEARIYLVNYIEFMYLYERKMYQECRMKIQASLSRVQIPVIIKAQYFMLCVIYQELGNTDRCIRLYSFIKQNIVFKEILQQNFFLVCLQASNAAQLQDLIFSKKNPWLFLPTILRRYFETSITKTSTKFAYKHIIGKITGDKQLIEYLNELQGRSVANNDKLFIFTKLTQHLSRYKLSEQLSQSEAISVQNYIFMSQIQLLWVNHSYGRIAEILEKYKGDINHSAILEYNPIIFDYIIKVYFISNEVQKMNNKIKNFMQTSKLMKSLEIWILTLTFKILFKINMEKYDWQEFKEFLLPILQFIDIHKVPKYVDSYCEAIRYFFHGEVNLIKIDQGLKVLSYQHFQWKYPLISFIHIEAIVKMSHILNKKQLQSYLYKLTAFFPFLKKSEQKWILQEYYHLALKFEEKARFQKYLRLKSRKYINYLPKLKKNHYTIARLVIHQRTCLNQFIAEKQSYSDVVYFLDETVTLGHSYCPKIFRVFENSLRCYHRNAGNETVAKMFRSLKELMRLKLS